MPKPEPSEYVTRDEAAKLLGVGADTITRWTKTGRLVSASLEKSGPKGGRPRVLYKRAHIMEMATLLANEPDMAQTHALGLRNAASVSTLERRVDEIYDAMGLGIASLPTDESSVRALLQETNYPPDRQQLRAVTWVRLWGSRFFGMNTFYFELAERVRPDAWQCYVGFGDLIEYRAHDLLEEVIQRDPELVRAYKYLAAAKRHLHYQSFMYCVQHHGLKAAVAQLGRPPNAIAEVSALLMN
jgi:transposase